MEIANLLAGTGEEVQPAGALGQAHKGLGSENWKFCSAHLQADGAGAGEQVQPATALGQARDAAHPRVDHGEHRRAHLQQATIGDSGFEAKGLLLLQLFPAFATARWPCHHSAGSASDETTLYEILGTQWSMAAGCLGIKKCCGVGRTISIMGRTVSPWGLSSRLPAQQGPVLHISHALYPDC